MSEYQPDVPRFDEMLTSRKLHEHCEKVAVPNFDWLNNPVVAIVDGLVHVESTRPRPRRWHRHRRTA
jgi:hypothetical protein